MLSCKLSDYLLKRLAIQKHNYFNRFFPMLLINLYSKLINTCVQHSKRLIVSYSLKFAAGSNDVCIIFLESVCFGRGASSIKS